MLKTNVKNEWVNVYLNEQLLSNYGHTYDTVAVLVFDTGSLGH